MIIYPEIMSTVTGSVAVFVGAMGVATLVVLVHKLVRPETSV